MGVSRPPDDMEALLRATAIKPGSAGPDCLDEGAIAAVVDGTLEVPARAAATRHLASCAHCRSAVTSAVRALADTSVRNEIARIEGGRRRRTFTRYVLPLAAAAALAVVF